MVGDEETRAGAVEVHNAAPVAGGRLAKLRCIANKYSGQGEQRGHSAGPAGRLGLSGEKQSLTGNEKWKCSMSLTGKQQKG